VPSWASVYSFSCLFVRMVSSPCHAHVYHLEQILVSMEGNSRFSVQLCGILFTSEVGWEGTRITFNGKSVAWMRPCFFIF
jgi:hypothetical protein